MAITTILILVFSIFPAVLMAETPPCDAKADIVFIMDSSESVLTSEYNYMLQFIVNITRNFDVGTNTVQFGAIAFSDYAKTVFDLNTYSDHASLEQGILSTPYKDGPAMYGGNGTYTGEALDLARTWAFTAANGARAGVPKIAIVFTDGESTDALDTQTQAAALKASGVKVISIGIGDSFNQTELEMIASSPQDVLEVTGFDVLDTINQQLTNQACDLASQCPAQADIVFIMDSSESIGQSNYDHMLQFIVNITRNFDVGIDKVHFGAIVFANDAQTVFNLNTYSDQASLEQAILATTYLKGVTYTGKALELARTSAFTAASGARAGVPKIAIVLTDGESTNPVDTQAQAASLKASGVNVISIGIGDNFNQAELEVIASSPQDVFTVTGFDVLDTINQQLTNRACDVVPRCDAQADIVFIMDSSESIGQSKYDNMLQFIVNITRNFDVGTNKVHFGAIVFANDAETVFNLNTYSDQASLEQAILATTYLKGVTNTGNALELARTSAFTAASGARVGVPKIAIVLTDGESTNPADTQAQAAALKASGVNVISIGIGDNFNQTELEVIASTPQDVLKVTGFDTLDTINQQLTNKACPPGCDVKADIVVIMDSSTSVGEANYDNMLKFIVNITRNFVVGTNKVHFGAIVFANDAQTVFNLNTYLDHASLEQAILNTTYLRGITVTGKALELARTSAFTAASGARDGVPKIAIIFTDGGSANRADTQAQAASLKATGVKVISIGIGDSFNQAELEGIASSPQDALNVTGYDVLDTINEELTNRTCNLATPAPPTTSTVSTTVTPTTSTPSATVSSSVSPSSTPAGLPKCSAQADIVFIMDSTGSVGETNYDNMLQFIVNITRNFVVGTNKVQFGAIAFADDAQIVFNLNTYSDHASLEQAILATTYLKGTTYTGKALELARTSAFTAASGARDGVPKIAIVLTDGLSFNPSDTQAQAAALKASGVKVISIGIGDRFNQAELEGIASSPQDVLKVTGYDVLDTISEQVTNKTCIVATPPPSTPSTVSTTPATTTPSTVPTTPETSTPSTVPSTPATSTPSTVSTTPATSSPSTVPTTPATSSPSTVPTTPTTSTPSTVSTTPATSSQSTVPTTLTTSTPSTVPTTPSTVSTTSPTTTPSTVPTTPAFSTTSTNPTTPSFSTTSTNPTTPAFSTTSTNPTTPTFSTTSTNPTTPAFSTTSTNPTTPAFSTTSTNPTTPAFSTTSTNPTTPAFSTTSTVSTTTPTTTPSTVPTTSPTTTPSTVPTTTPTTTPSTVPTTTPTTTPSTVPTTTPTTTPSTVPTTTPTTTPSTVYTTTPTTTPSTVPTTSPTTTPSTVPSTSRTTTPSTVPTTPQTSTPSTVPTTSPTTTPSTVPTTTPTTTPSTVPTTKPTTTPSTVPTTTPTTTPSIVPTTKPTTTPSTVPTTTPTTTPSTVPTTTPTTTPSTVPTTQTTSTPSTVPTTPTTLTPSTVPTTPTTLTPSTVPTTPTTSTPSTVPTTPATSTPSTVPTTTTAATPSTVPTTPTTSTLSTSSPKCQAQADIVFIMDSSGSVGQTNYDNMLQFIVNITRNFDVDTNKVQFGAIVFSYDAQTVFNLNTYSDHASLEQAILATTYLGSGTYTDKALELARTSAFTAASGARVGVPKIAIVLTDGGSAKPTDTKEQAAALKASGVTVISIGIIGDSFNQTELEGIASSPQDVLKVTGYEVLDTINEQVTNRTCIVVTSPTSTPSTVSTTPATSTPSTVPTTLATSTPSTVQTTETTNEYTPLTTGISSPAGSTPVTSTPSTVPTTKPTTTPSTVPTTTPTTTPSTVPTTTPTTTPSTVPTTTPTTTPSTVPTTTPTTTPSTVPTTTPTTTPSTVPTTTPTSTPSTVPTTPAFSTPSTVPTTPAFSTPSTVPTTPAFSTPSTVPTTPAFSTTSTVPTTTPTTTPSTVPTTTPTTTPSTVPTTTPTTTPSTVPTTTPTMTPSTVPTTTPTTTPSTVPTTTPTTTPSTVPTTTPTTTPSTVPTTTPTTTPSTVPTTTPTTTPSTVPTTTPTTTPSTVPTTTPTTTPSTVPTTTPTTTPSTVPTTTPTTTPSTVPTTTPSTVPTTTPTTTPSTVPTTTDTSTLSTNLTTPPATPTFSTTDNSSPFSWPSGSTSTTSTPSTDFTTPTPAISTPSTISSTSVSTPTPPNGYKENCSCAETNSRLIVVEEKLHTLDDLLKRQSHAHSDEFYDILNTGYNEWRLAFRGTPYIGKSLYEAYTSRKGAHCNPEPECKKLDGTLTCQNHYRNSDVLDNWTDIDEVALVLYLGKTQVKHMIFDGQGSTYMDWLSQDRLKLSSWVDAKNETMYCSLEGNRINNDRRRFYINHEGGGCAKDSGWFVAIDTDGVFFCDWERNDRYPVFKYARGDTYTNFSAGDIGTASIMAIFVKYTTSGIVG